MELHSIVLSSQPMGASWKHDIIDILWMCCLFLIKRKTFDSIQRRLCFSAERIRARRPGLLSKYEKRQVNFFFDETLRQPQTWLLREKFYESRSPKIQEFAAWNLCLFLEWLLGCNIHNGDISTAGGPHITVSVLDSLPLTNLLPLMTHTILR